MDTPTPPYQPLIEDLLAFADLKVWSVLVTIFGDLAFAERAYLPGPYLSDITGRLGIRTEAQRVALHRLRKDGWITVAKDGRVSRYSLSDLARQETLAVQSRVFDDTVDRPTRAYLILEPSGPGRTDLGGIKLSNGSILTDRRPTDARDLMVSDTAIADLPEWIRTQVLPAETQDSYRRLLDVLSAKVSIPDMPMPDQLTLRILTLHRWRRLVLSHTRTAAHLMGPDWIGNACRARVHQILRQASRPPSSHVT
jgi:phenylacetic acid degradation operon negative regulatory protein